MGNKFTRRRVVVDDRYTRPQGLYQHGDVDHKKLRRLILDAKLAPCYPGADDAATDLDECPICFLFYPSLNRSKCCTKGICTECFLQMKSPQAARTTQCPFCKCPSYAVEYRGAKSIEEKGFEEAEEQKVIEAKIRMRQKELQDEEQRMLRREEDVREGRIPAPSDLLRLNFPNLHGFTIPSGSAEVESALLRDSIPERGLTHGQNEGRLSEGQPQVDHTAIPVVAGGSDSGSRDSQQDVNLVPSANLLASQRSLARRRMGIGSSGGNSMHGQAARVLGASRFNREDEFDLDLEDIMVMEAIWLSIQEQGPMEQESVSSGPGNLVTSDSASTEIDQNSSSGNNDAHPLLPPAGETRDVPAGRSSVTGGLAGAIAALAERQVLSVDSATTRQIHQNSGIGSETGDSSANMASNSIPIVNATQSMFAEVDEIAEVLPAVATAASSNTQVNRVEDLEGENKLTESEPEEESEHPTWIEPQDNHTLDSQVREQGHNMWIEVSLESGRALSPYVHEDSRGSRTDWMQGHSSEAVEVVTSFSSSVPSASELPWEAPDFAPVQNMEGTIESQGFAAPPPMVPESFEEQMMLAMALSLAEAQAQSRPRRL